MKRQLKEVRTIATAADASTVRAAPWADTRERLVWHGLELLTQQAFNATGIEQILSGLNIPKGSFYHYFPSKHAFGVAVVDRYVAYFDEKFDRLLGDDRRPPLDRLRAYVDDCCAGMARHNWRRGCLVGNLAQELGAHDDDFRDRLEAVLESWQDRIAALLREAAVRGDLTGPIDADRLAQFFWIGWEGALMRAKLTRDSSPLNCFVDHFFALLPVRQRPDATVR